MFTLHNWSHWWIYVIATLAGGVVVAEAFLYTRSQASEHGLEGRKRILPQGSGKWTGASDVTRTEEYRWRS